MNPNRKRTKLKPYGPYRNTHPFYLWQVLHRFKVMDKLAGVDHYFRTDDEIAKMLFSNYDNLPEYTQTEVRWQKIDLPLLFLKQYGYAEYQAIDGNKTRIEARARGHVFENSEQLSNAQVLDLEYDLIDSAWKEYVQKLSYYRSKDKRR